MAALLVLRGNAAGVGAGAVEQWPVRWPRPTGVVVRVVVVRVVDVGGADVGLR
ncbi:MULTISPECIES: hypothetical protein [Actinosynnema]|uniref:hypothetical protein n=1 Tax=Actinosynnema TaxID=40566 RepID=UPI0031D94C86|nr:hypothetical protein [Actinosynnema pretiosum]